MCLFVLIHICGYILPPNGRLYTNGNVYSFKTFVMKSYYDNRIMNLNSVDINVVCKNNKTV